MCVRCGGSGWVVRSEGGREFASECECRRQDVGRIRITQANIPPRFAAVELRGYLPHRNNASQARAKKAAEKFVADYPALEGGLLFHGPTGVGKTRLLCSIANQLIREKNCEAFYIDWNDLVREMRSGEDYASRDYATIGQLIQRMSTVELLLFDELGASRPSPWVIDNIYYFVNSRYNNGRVTLFASNYADEVEAGQETLKERVGERIRSRLFEMARSVTIHGEDYRREYK